jgi:23S rRNA (cytosine1962-C5)-methyltransferase
MITADNWRDYELIDVSGGERLERWGKYILVRPDPQAIWDTPRLDPRWSAPDAQYSRSQSGGGVWVRNNLPHSWKIKYRELTFLVRAMNFKHTGIFPEQAANWDYIAQQSTGNAGAPLKLLNLFAYTGGATVAALASGMECAHVDAAKGMVSQAKENAAASGVADRPVRWLVDDCRKFVSREVRRGNHYDAIIMDPPSYGRGADGSVWKLEDDLYSFAELTAGVLSDKPKFVIINSYTAGLSPSVMKYIADSVFTARFGGAAIADELGLPVSSNGLVFPCGSVMRWESGN